MDDLGPWNDDKNDLTSFESFTPTQTSKKIYTSNSRYARKPKLIQQPALRSYNVGPELLRQKFQELQGRTMDDQQIKLYTVKRERTGTALGQRLTKFINRRETPRQDLSSNTRTKLKLPIIGKSIVYSLY